MIPRQVLQKQKEVLQKQKEIQLRKYTNEVAYQKLLLDNISPFKSIKDKDNKSYNEDEKMNVFDSLLNKYPKKGVPIHSIQKIQCAPTTMTPCTDYAKSKNIKLQCGSNDSQGAFITVGTLQVDTLFHGSPYLFMPPFLPTTKEVSFSPWTSIPFHWSQKIETLDDTARYVYEYRVKKEVLLKYHGIPNILSFCGSATSIIEAGADSKLTLSDRLAKVCHENQHLGWFYPVYESQVLLCASTVKDILEINRIYQAYKFKSKKYLILLYDTTTGYIKP